MEPTPEQKALAEALLKIILTRPLARLFWRRSIKKAYWMACAFDTWFAKKP